MTAEEILNNLSKDLDKMKIEDLKKEIVKLAAAYKMGQELVSVHEIEKLVQLLIERVTSMLRVEVGSLMLVDKMQKELRIKAAKGLKKEIVEQARVKFGEGISGWVAKEAKPLLIEDLKRHPTFERRNGKYNTDSLLTVPLVAGGEVIGVLNVNNKETKDIFNKDDLDTLIMIANQAAVLIKNSQEYEEIKKLNRVKSDFVSMVSHELRSPLAAVKESLAVVLDNIAGTLNKKQREILSIAEKSIDRLNRLVNDLLDFSKMEAGRMQMDRRFISISKLVDDVTEGFKPSADKKSISLSVRLSADIKGIWADYDRIIQVLNNLISNAIKYTPKGGRIEVILDRKDKNIEIIVKDSGIGIKPDDIEKIFDRFSNISFKGDGMVSTGLGLAITKDIVELHKGSIQVKSEVGKGSEFIVRLPADLRSVSV